jgi:hypothetical protein
MTWMLHEAQMKIAYGALTPTTEQTNEFAAGNEEKK